MKALTLTQPWATLVAVGAKRIETRSWGTSYRGRLAIHAAAGFPADCQDLTYTEPFNRVLRARFDPLWRPSDLPRGAVVAVVNLLTCVRIAGVREQPDWLHDRSYEEDVFGDYTPWRYAWLLELVERIEPPIPAKGARGLWDWSPNAQPVAHRAPGPTPRERSLFE